jgi:subtilisin family serine protease
MNRQWLYKLFVWSMLVVLVTMPLVASAQEGAPGNSPIDRLTPVTSEDGRPVVIENYQMRPKAGGSNEYFVELDGEAVVDTWLRAQRSEVSAAAVQAQFSALQAQQADVVNGVQALGGEVIASYQKVFNGLAVRIPAEQVKALLSLPGVVRITPIPEYYKMLDETVPWVGAAALQSLGYDGSGIRVAVLDSGIDYTHEHLGGSGTLTDTAKAIAEASQPADPTLYPTAKVIGGYDFVGSDWPNSPEAPDPNPMDDEGGSVDGHGTHVASIIGGVQTASLGPGVAPGVEFYALKVCSSISTACSGAAMMAGLEWAADPDGDLFFDDRADVVNMSLGSPYGQVNDAADVAVARLVGVGAVVVASAGNSANVPFIMGSPSSSRAAISVAQSTVPSAINNEMVINEPASIAGTAPVVHYSWSGAWNSEISGTVRYVGHTGCDTDPAITGVTGQIALIDRGVCNFSDKVYNAQQAGAIAAIIGLVAPGDPFEGSQGSHFGEITIPGFNTTQAASTAIKTAQAASETVVVTLDPMVGTPLPDTMVSTSSRGPRFDLTYLKPDISAPGASISASSGQQGYSKFGGTSGAAPMVAGAAALLLDAAGGPGSLPPHVIKARLMNNAETVTWEDQPGGKLNPISRQGAGRLDVLAAHDAETIAWVPADHDVALSFGLQSVAHPYTDTKSVQVINVGAADKEYEIGVTYRYADDEDAGVVVATDVDTLNVSAGDSSTFDVNLSADPALIKPWTLTSGGRYSDGNRLTDTEVDGYVTLTETTTLSVTNVPFHFVPLQSADVEVGEAVGAGDVVQVPLTNTSVITGMMEAAPLFDVSPSYTVFPKPLDAQPVDIQYVSADAFVFDADAGENMLLFGISTYENRSHPINVEHDIYIDIDQDGLDDYVAFNADLGLLQTGTIDGRQVSALVDLETGTTVAQFFLDSRLSSNNMVIPVVVPDNNLAFNFQVWSFDFYYGGFAWDISPLDESYHIYDASAPAFEVEANSFDIVGNVSDTSTITKATTHLSPSQIGIVYRTFNGPEGNEMNAVTLPTVLPDNVNLSIEAEESVTTGELIDVTGVLTFGNEIPWSGQTIFFSDGTFSASLSGENEVPPVTTDGSGEFTATVNPLTGLVNYTLDVQDLTDITMAHIHRGYAGQTGGVAYWLYDAAGVNAPGGEFPVTGSFTITNPADLDLLLDGGLYVNVHTTANASGEIRGQVMGAVPSVTDQFGEAEVTWLAEQPGTLRLWAFGADQIVFTDVVVAEDIYLPIITK